MSDATAPHSSEAPASRDGNRSDSSQLDRERNTPGTQTEGQDSKGNISGDGAGKQDNKQKRKRTSPKDQSTLEAEYRLNDKPNKAARAVIVSKVDLNEKEVQIWFQNRRQIQRRRSRPLLPHEIAAFGIGNMASMSSDPSSLSMFNSSQTVEEPVSTSAEEEYENSQETEFTGPEELLDAEERLQSEKPVEVAHELSSEVARHIPSSTPLPLPPLKRDTSFGPLDLGTSSNSFPSAYKSFSSTPGYLANRWNTTNSSYSTPASSQAKSYITPAISNSIQPSSCPERIGTADSPTRSSWVRLSLSLDGKAELISSEPSPPRPSSSGSVVSGTIIQRRGTGLQRSQSALTFGPLPPISISLVPRLPRGRSRDARSWRFACDSESRDELTMQAENEASGSAVAAISLLRSMSNAVLKTNPNKRNAPSAKHDSSALGKKPKLGRAQSSLARLQSSGLESKLRSSKGDDGMLHHSPSGDSDKENWLPREGGGNVRRRSLVSSSDVLRRSKPVLGENINPSVRTASLGVSKNKRQKGAAPVPEIFEDQENAGEVGEEVEKFMRGEVSPSKRGDFEGAQALLAIMGSGSWR